MNPPSVRPLAAVVLVALLLACGRAPGENPAPPSTAPVPDQGAPVGASDSGVAATEAATAPAAEEGSQQDASVPDPPPLTPLGVPECDKFVEKYMACMERHVPEEQKERLMRELHLHRVRWLELEKMQDGKLAAGLACRGVAQRLKGDLIVDFGCEF